MKVNWSDCLSAVRQAKSIALFAHRNADGDALGSVYALAVALSRGGKDVCVFTEEIFDEKLHFLMSETVRTVLLVKDGAGKLLDKNAADSEIPQSALGIALDCADADRMAPLCRAVFDTCGYKIKIDHHLPGEHADFADINIADPAWAATAEGLYEFLLLYCDGKAVPFIDREIAIRLYTGILTDTGRFVYSSTTGNTLRTVAALVDITGSDLTWIARSLFDMKTPCAARLLAAAYEKAELLLGGKVVFLWLTPADFEKAGAALSDADAIVSTLLNLEGAEVSVFAKPQTISAAPGTLAETAETELYKISARSTEQHNVAAFCAKFGGGGHKCAAGCNFTGNAELLKQAVISEFRDGAQK